MTSHRFDIYHSFDSVRPGASVRSEDGQLSAIESSLTQAQFSVSEQYAELLY